MDKSIINQCSRILLSSSYNELLTDNKTVRYCYSQSWNHLANQEAHTSLSEIKIFSHDFHNWCNKNIDINTHIYAQVYVGNTKIKLKLPTQCIGLHSETTY